MTDRTEGNMYDLKINVLVTVVLTCLIRLLMNWLGV